MTSRPCKNKKYWRSRQDDCWRCSPRIRCGWRWNCSKKTIGTGSSHMPNSWPVARPMRPLTGKDGRSIHNRRLRGFLSPWGIDSLATRRFSFFSTVNGSNFVTEPNSLESVSLATFPSMFLTTVPMFGRIAPCFNSTNLEKQFSSLEFHQIISQLRASFGIIPCTTGQRCRGTAISGGFVGCSSHSVRSI